MLLNIATPSGRKVESARDLAATVAVPVWLEIFVAAQAAVYHMIGAENDDEFVLVKNVNPGETREIDM
jgi:hypothetical protein